MKSEEFKKEISSESKDPRDQSFEPDIPEDYEFSEEMDFMADLRRKYGVYT